MIKIHNFPASYGDTFLVNIIEEGEDEVNILIDCGKGFATTVKPMLTIMGENSAHKIDRFIVTHFDDDHISGLYSFLKDNGDADDPKIIEIDQIWLNTFRHLQFAKRKAVSVTGEERNRLELFKSGFPNTNTEKKEEEVGANQALLAGKLIYERKYKWNTDFDGKACMAFSRNKIADNVVLHILTPTVEKLHNIESDFIRELQSKFGLEPTAEDIFDDAYELYVKNVGLGKKKEEAVSAQIAEISIEGIAQVLKETTYVPDNAAGNGSSISFILETQTKKVLFLADAHAEDVIDSLKKMFPERKGLLFFDAIKVAHHGSFRNNSPKLFELIDSDKFIFSTNGKHPKHVHPDIATIAHIISRPLSVRSTARTLYFNHDFVEKQAHLTCLLDKQLGKKYNYTISMDREVDI